MRFSILSIHSVDLQQSARRGNGPKGKEKGIREFSKTGKEIPLSNKLASQFNYPREKRKVNGRECEAWEFAFAKIKTTPRFNVIPSSPPSYPIPINYPFPHFHPPTGK